MVKKIGIRELKNKTSGIIRSVREEMAEYVVTHHGKPIAILRPLNEAERERLETVELAQSLEEMKALSNKVAANWSSTKSGLDLVEEQRRD